MSHTTSLRTCSVLSTAKHSFCLSSCFTSTETTRLIRDGPVEVVGRGDRCLSLRCHHKNDSCIKISSDESHFNVSLWLWGTRSQDSVHKPQPFWREGRAESSRGPSAYQPSALPLGQTGLLTSQALITWRGWIEVWSHSRSHWLHEHLDALLLRGSRLWRVVYVCGCLNRRFPEITGEIIRKTEAPAVGHRFAHRLLAYIGPRFQNGSG